MRTSTVNDRIWNETNKRNQGVFRKQLKARVNWEKSWILWRCIQRPPKISVTEMLLWELQKVEKLEGVWEREGRKKMEIVVAES